MVTVSVQTCKFGAKLNIGKRATTNKLKSLVDNKTNGFCKIMEKKFLRPLNGMFHAYWLNI